MLAKGNVWYTVHYRLYFDQYVCGYLVGRRGEPIQRDGVHLVPLGTGRLVIDLLMAPLRVYRLSKTVRATHFLTADLILAWWHFWLLRVLTGARPMVMPVCTPDEILRLSGRSFSGLPVWMERLFISLSFLAADRVLCFQNHQAGIEWVRSTSFGRKLKIVDLMPEEFSAPEFLERLRSGGAGRFPGGVPPGPSRLVYVGRLEREKLVDDLVDAMLHLQELGKSFHLTIVGDGAERAHLEGRVRSAGLNEKVTFAGFLAPNDVAGVLLNSDIFVSPYTGTALREAALAGLAIVAYRLGGIENVFRDGENCVLVEASDRRGLAEQVAQLIDAPERRTRLAANVRTMAERVWSTDALRRSLAQAFELA